MFLEFLVVQVILWISATVTPVANMTPFVLFSAVSVELVVAIEALSAKITFWMSLEARLVDCTRIVITKFLVSAEFTKGKELVFVGENFLVASAEVAHHFAMLSPDMTMEVGPAVACLIAVLVGTVVSKE